MKLKLLILCGALWLGDNQQFQNPNAPNTTEPWGYNYIPPLDRPWMQPSGGDNYSSPIIIDERTIIIIQPKENQ